MQTTQDANYSLVASTFVTGGDDYSDSTVVAGKTWEELKISATDAGYKNRSTYKGLSADNKTLMDALIKG
jgi:hypothetical protein